MALSLHSLASAPALQPLRSLRATLSLAATQRRTFDPANLGQIDDNELAALFRDRTISGDWETDHRAITALFPDRNIPGGLNPGERRALYFLLRALPARVLEIGTHVGASTIHIARALSADGRGARLTIVDLVD